MFGLVKKKVHTSQASSDYWEAASSSLPGAWDFLTAHLKGLSDLKKLSQSHISDCLTKSENPTQKFHTFRCAFCMIPIWNMFDQKIAINIRNFSVLPTIAEEDFEATAAAVSFVETFNHLSELMPSDPVGSPVRFLVDSLCLNSNLPENVRFDDPITALSVNWIILQDPLLSFWTDYAKKYRVVL